MIYKRYVPKTKSQYLLPHGENDTSVEINNGRRLAKWANVELCVIKNTDHVFGAKHPCGTLKSFRSHYGNYVSTH